MDYQYKQLGVMTGKEAGLATAFPETAQVKYAVYEWVIPDEGRVKQIAIPVGSAAKIEEVISNILTMGVA